MQNTLRNQAIQTQFKLKKLWNDNHLQRWGINMKMELERECVSTEVNGDCDWR